MSDPSVVVLGAAAGPRLEAFREALARLRKPAAFVSYEAFLTNPATLENVLSPNTILRFDSPDGDEASRYALNQLGAEAAAKAGFAIFEGRALNCLMEHYGAVGSLFGWFVQPCGRRCVGECSR